MDKYLSKQRSVGGCVEQTQGRPDVASAPPSSFLDYARTWMEYLVARHRKKETAMTFSTVVSSLVFDRLDSGLAA